MGGLSVCEKSARLLRPPCHQRPAAPTLRRSAFPHVSSACDTTARPRYSGLLLAVALVFGTPLLAADEVAPAEAELLLFLAEFADAEGEVPELGLLEQAGLTEANALEMNEAQADGADPASATKPSALGRSEQTPRPTHEDRPRLRGRAEQPND